MVGEISPESDWFTREILVTWPDIGSQEIPGKLQGDSLRSQLCNVFKGSFNCILNWRRAWVSTIKAVEGGKRESQQKVVKRGRK